MSRNERDWNRRIPQRQAPQASPSRLLRTVANEHIPEPEPVTPQTLGWARPTTTTDGFSLTSSSRVFDRQDPYYRALFESMTVPRNQGRSLQGDFDGDMGEYLREEVLREIRTQSNASRTAGSTGWGRSGTNWGTVSSLGGGYGGGGGNFGGGGAGVAPPLTQIPRTEETRGYPVARTVEVDIPRQRRAMTFVVPEGVEIAEGRIQGLTENLRVEVERESQRLLRVGLEDISIQLRSEDGMANVSQTMYGDNRRTYDDRGSGSIRSSNSIDMNEIRITGSISGQGTHAGNSTVAEEIKAWIKSALEVRTELTEEDGNLSLKTTVLLDGEEVSSDSDFVTIRNPHSDDF